MGITDPNLNEPDSQDYEDIAASSSPRRHTSDQPSLQPGKEPLWNIRKDEGIRLCRVYDEEIGIMYPMLDVDKVVQKAERLFTFIESANRTGLISMSKPGADTMQGPEINVLKMILGTALTLEGGGQSELGNALFDSVREACESKLSEPVDAQGLRLLVIVVS